MADPRRLWRQGSVATTAGFSGALLFWVALHCKGSDWFISETHADIIYTSLLRFREFPYFSFVFNGGSYFIQDPQSNLFSPAVILILLAGPSVGVRLMAGVWGALGVYVFTVWMTKRVSWNAALIGAVASVTSLGVLWRIAVGNDMFLWHLGLPALFWIVERVLVERTIRSALAFGVILGLLLLGPTFHSFTYLYLPAVSVFVLVEWAFQRPRWAELSRAVALLLAACAIALLIASPKLACWLQFPMSRQVRDAGVIGMSGELRCLFDYLATKHVLVTTTFMGALGRMGRWHRGIEECAVALPPIGSFLALLGLATPFVDRTNRRTAVLALILVMGGAVLSGSWTVWSGFRTLTGGNFRAAPRFLSLAAFGLAIFCALGAELLISRLSRLALPVTLAIASAMLGSAVWWTSSAGQFGGDSPDDAVYPEAFNPLRRASEESASLAELRTFTDLVTLDGHERMILKGSGYSDGFLVVGNDFEPDLWRSRRELQILKRGLEPSELRVAHVHITLNHVPPHGRVVLRAREPRFGLSIRTVPPNLPVDVHPEGTFLVVQNISDKPIDRVILRATWPISLVWFVVSVFTLLAAFFGLVVFGRTARLQRAQPTPFVQ